VSALGYGDLAAIDVGRLKGVGDKKRSSLGALGVENLLDLLTFYPRRWIDRSNEARLGDLVPGEEALVLVTVRSVTKRVTRNRRTMVNVNVGDGSGRMDVVFFNQPWRERQLREGLHIALFGKADVYRGGLQMSNPVVDLIGDGADLDAGVEQPGGPDDLLDEDPAHPPRQAGSSFAQL